MVTDGSRFLREERPLRTNIVIETVNARKMQSEQTDKSHVGTCAASGSHPERVCRTNQEQTVRERTAAKLRDIFVFFKCDSSKARPDMRLLNKMQVKRGYPYKIQKVTRGQTLKRT